MTEDSAASFLCDGSGVRFDLPFVFFAEGELQVVEYDPATGTSLPRALNTHYTVVGGKGASGAVIANIAPQPGRQWRVWRRTRRRQATDYQENDAFAAAVHEVALDRLQAQIQEVDADHERTLRLAPFGEAVAPLPPLQDGAFLRARTDPPRVEWAPLATAGALVVTPYMQTLLDDDSAAAARSTLGLGSGPGTVTSVDLAPAGGAAGLSFQGGPVTGAGVIGASLALQTLPVDATPNPAADYLVTYSGAANAHRKVRIDQVPIPAVADGSVTQFKLANSAVTAAKMASGAAVQGGSNAAGGSGQIFLDRQGDLLRFRRLVVQRTVVGAPSGNVVSDVGIAVATGSDTVTITLTVTRSTISTGGGTGGE
jgi:hypothetical protein